MDNPPLFRTFPSLSSSFSLPVFFTYRLPPSHETPCPSLSAHQWGAEKLLFRRTKYSSCWSQECKQQGTAEHNSNPQVSESSQATFCLLTTNRTQSPDFLFSDEFFCSALCTLVCLQIYSNACSEQDRLGWSPRLNLYWWPSTHPPALGPTCRALSGISWHQIEPSTDRDLGFYPHKYFHFIQIH